MKSTRLFQRLLILIAACLATGSLNKSFAQTSTATGLPDVQVHGFVSQGFMLSSGNNYLAKSKRGSFEFSEVGINFTTQLTEQLRAGMQLFARDLGPIGNYSAKVDWFYLDYRWRDWLGFRAGRLKLPFGLYNEFQDTDAAFAPVLLPQSVYPIQNRDFLLAQTGAEIYGFVDLHQAGGLEYRLYAGTIYLPFERNVRSPFDIDRLEVPYVIGGRVLWEAPVPGLRIGGSVQALRLDTEIVQNGATVADVSIPAGLWVASVEYAPGDWLLAAEYSRWHLDLDSSNPAAYPESSSTQERAYIMGGYRFLNWLQASSYYAVYFPNANNRTQGREDMQHDLAASIRFDMNKHWLIKLEGHFFHGTAGLSAQLNDYQPLSTLERNWVMFLAKTTGYF